MAPGLRTALTALTLLVAAPAVAAPPKDEDAEFAKRMAALTKAQGAVIAVKMKPGDDPAKLPENGAGNTGLVMVASGRTGIYTPPLLSPDDISSVVQQHMVDVRSCYKAQLAEDPEWSDRLILDLAVKKTGRVSEVSVAPKRVQRAAIGQCLMKVVPNWSFPQFTGETDEGVTQEVVNASFPFSFSVD
jgi:hypothetical protein